MATIQVKWKSKKWKMTTHVVNGIDSLDYSMSYDADEKEKEKRTVTLSYPVHVGLGVKLKTEINSWYKLLGQSGPIYFGTKRFGPKKMKLLSADVSGIELGKGGAIISADISLKFEEVKKSAKS